MSAAADVALRNLVRAVYAFWGSLPYPVESDKARALESALVEADDYLAAPAPADAPACPSETCGGYRCELPPGHTGLHRAFIGAEDEQGRMSELVWPPGAGGEVVAEGGSHRAAETGDAATTPTTTAGTRAETQTCRQHPFPAPSVASPALTPPAGVEVSPAGGVFGNLRPFLDALSAQARELDLLAETARRLTAQRDAALERVTEYGDALAFLEMEALHGGVRISRTHDGSSTLLSTGAGVTEMCMITPTLLECVVRTRLVRAAETGGADGLV